MLCKSHMLLTIFSLYVFLLCSVLQNCSAIARDSITFNTSITDDTGNQTLVSAHERFELGFFTPNESLNKARYVGIWYYNSTPQTVVWVANRDNPLFDHTGVFAVTEDGNLKVFDKKGKSYWSTELESPSSFKRAKLRDSGNLILIDDMSSEIVWESFHHPTDTFLPGMNMDKTMQLSSWKSGDDPAKGNFTFQRDKGIDQFITQKRSLPYWSNGESSEFISFEQIPSEIASLLSNFREICSTETPYSPCRPSRSTHEYTYMRLVLNFNGEIQYLRKDVGKKNWVLIWREPRDRCHVSNACGDFGSCNNNINKQLVCKCLPGFKPRFLHHWNGGDFSGGCIRKSDICGKSDTFLSLKMMKARNPDSKYRAQDESECRKECLVNCNCQAYSYESSDNTSMCWIWMDNLSRLQEEYANGSHTLFVRVNSSDIKLTRRDCKTCGTNTIPYPLSTGPDCGDPMYFNLRCNKATGQVSFTVHGDTYQITSINSTAREIYIKRKDIDNCETRNMREKIQQINQLSAFHLSYWWCNNASDEGNSSSGMSSKRRDEIVINWDPPLEPPCTSSTDCKDWPNSTCNTTRDGKKRCLCIANFQWNNNSSLRCTQVSEGNKQSSRRKKSLPLILVVTFTIVIVLIALSWAMAYILHRRRRRQETRQRNQALYMADSERRIKDLMDSDQFREEDKKGIDVPFFDLETILVATDNFSDANKLGKGGFGPVYKGKFPGGREIAVKKLSGISRQGLTEFKNEVLLIAKLQHRNLVRLLGYCIEGEQKMILYEYMPNKSLDSFIFDRELCAALDWQLRFNIILGIARGLLYLHRDSRLKIIHRDLKTSNILLDSAMNPKISDFGLAKMFGGKQTEANTNRVVGTYGYMSPEYALDGLFSAKSDVFSFGVVILEIISGKRNARFYQSEQALSLLGYAWRLWNEDKALDLMDESLCESCNTNEFLKCVNVGLLCVQDDPNDRPTMSNIVVMLIGSEAATLPTPKQPAFIVRRDPSDITSSSRLDTLSNNELTITMEEGR